MSGSSGCSPMREVDVVYRPEALADLEHIYRFLVDLSLDPTIARAHVGRIRERCRRIGMIAQGGTPRDDLEPGLRTVPSNGAPS